jgi:hypothetical protein
MSEDTPRGPAGEIVESSTVCTLEELCEGCQVEADWIAALVEQGALDPLGRSRHEWRFTRLSVVRVAKRGGSSAIWISAARRGARAYSSTSSAPCAPTPYRHASDGRRRH